MTRLTRLLAPLSVAAAFALAAPVADALSTAQFPPVGPTTTVAITDPGPSLNTVHLTVTVADPDDLAGTRVFLGGDGDAPYFSIGVDGVRDARYDNDVEYESELSTAECSVIGSSLIYTDAPVTVAGGGASFSADLPKGVIISFQFTGVAVGHVGVDTPCTSDSVPGLPGLAIDYVADHQTIDGFAWQAPAAPVVTAAEGGQRQVALSFDQDPGTVYDIYRVVGGVRESTPFLGNVRGDGTGVQVVLNHGPDDAPLAAGAAYAFQVQATRLFTTISGGEPVRPISPFSAVATATTATIQTVRFTGGPAASTTARTAQFSWAIDANVNGAAPWCLLDANESSGTEVPCTTTGASIAGLAVGAHTLIVVPSDGEAWYPYTWTVVAEPAAAPAIAPTTTPAATVVPIVPKANPFDLDGDGITTTWLVGGKAVAAPGTPKARVTAGSVRLKLSSAPKGAKKVRVYRADGKGGFTLVKTLSLTSGTFVDKKVKAGHTYTYKTVAVNAKGQQGKASKAATAKVPKKKKKK